MGELLAGEKKVISTLSLTFISLTFTGTSGWLRARVYSCVDWRGNLEAQEYLLRLGQGSQQGIHLHLPRWNRTHKGTGGCGILLNVIWC